jgi:hypothetical protein
VNVLRGIEQQRAELAVMEDFAVISRTEADSKSRSGAASKSTTWT